MSSTVTQQRMEVEQLRREAAMKRIPVSQAVDDIKVMINVSKFISITYCFSLMGNWKITIFIITVWDKKTK